MAIYLFTENNLEKLERTNFSNENILERQHLQFALEEQINIIASDCLVINEEVSV